MFKPASISRLYCDWRNKDRSLESVWWPLSSGQADGSGHKLSRQLDEKVAVPTNQNANRSEGAKPIEAKVDILL